MTLLQIHEPGQTPDPHSEGQSLAIGIDLGTTHSVMAIRHGLKVDVIHDAAGDGIIPSVVSFAHGVKVGRQALAEADAIHSIKRLMGKSSAQTKAQEIAKLSTKAGIKTPVEISAEILRYLKIQAEDALGQEIGKAVITVPAYFDDAARNATKEAARLAGLDVLRLLNEPTAAALAYGLDEGAEGIYAVYDLGGGTFDVSVLKMEKGVFQVLSTCGDVQLGGDDIDALIAQKLHINVADARRIKESLSGDNESAHQAAPLSKTDLNALALPLVMRTIALCDQALRDAGLNQSDIKDVVLVGGSTRMPLVREQLAAWFGRPALAHLDPDQTVAIGAAIQAEALTFGADHLLLDVIPLSLGLETMGGIVEKLIHRNTPIPITAHQEFTTYQDGQSAMSIHVLQGEREMADQCRSLAQFTLSGIPPMPANLARIKVSFVVDADGLLTVSASEQTTGTTQHVAVKPSYGLDFDAIETMIRASMEHGQADIMARLLAEAKIEGQRLLNDLQSAIRLDKELLEAEERRQLDAQMARLRDALEQDNRDLIDYEMQRLNEMANPFAARRMDKAIASALEGSHIDSVG